jgi:hypothetical protein
MCSHSGDQGRRCDQFLVPAMQLPKRLMAMINFQSDDELAREPNGSFEYAFSPGWCHEPGLKVGFSSGLNDEPGLKVPNL